jgi:hypothetical protein
VSLATNVALPAGNNNIGDVDIATIAAGDNNIGNVDIASAIPAGTNNIGDIDVLTVPADPFGVNSDAASVSTSISAKLKAIATALGVTALDLGSGTGGTRTLRVMIDSGQVSPAADQYEPVLASQSAQVLGATGAVGDHLAGVLIVPETTTPGIVSVTDGNGTAFTVFPGGASSISNLVPFFVPLGIKAVNATTPGWKVTTGANVHCMGVGTFT